jgi:myo-inositol-hexaphosphate 3-phosphohydrolase
MGSGVGVAVDVESVVDVEVGVGVMVYVTLTMAGTTVVNWVGVPETVVGTVTEMLEVVRESERDTDDPSVCVDEAGDDVDDEVSWARAPAASRRVAHLRSGAIVVVVVGGKGGN